KKAYSPMTRRKRANIVQPLMRRSGVTASANNKKRNAHRPVAWVNCAIGSAPSRSHQISASNHASGSSASRCTANLGHNSERCVAAGAVIRSVPLAQIHARVQRGHLLAITVEGQRGNAVGKHATAVAGETSLGFLAPAWMIHI